jgi:hypothetical protein
LIVLSVKNWTGGLISHPAKPVTQPAPHRSSVLHGVTSFAGLKLLKPCLPP